MRVFYRNYDITISVESGKKNGKIYYSVTDTTDNSLVATGSGSNAESLQTFVTFIKDQIDAMVIDRKSWNEVKGQV